MELHSTPFLFRRGEGTQSRISEQRKALFMKVICNRGALLDALNLTGNVVAARTPKPVLQCLKLTAEDNALIIAATDLEVAIRYRDEQVQIEQGGETLAPADKLRDIVRESIDDTLSIETTGDTAN